MMNEYATGGNGFLMFREVLHDVLVVVVCIVADDGDVFHGGLFGGGNVT